jgi:hypothetical protein
LTDNNGGFQQKDIESNVDELYEKVFKNLRRLFAHMKLIDMTKDSE